MRGLSRRCAVVAVALLAGCTTTAAGLDPLEVDGTTAHTHLLTPGKTVHWPVTVTVNAEDLQALSLQLLADSIGSQVSPALGAAMQVEVTACDEPWEDAVCSQSEETVIPKTPLGTLPKGPRGMNSDWLLKRVFLLVAVTLDRDAASSVQADSARLTIVADASGGSGSPEEVSGLPDTGARVGLAVLVGCLLTGVGLVLGRRRMGGSDA